MAKTPRWDFYNGYLIRRIDGETATPIAEVLLPTRRPRERHAKVHREQAKNGRLMAAAPDLLEALYITSNCAPITAELDALPADAEVTLTFCAEDLRQIRGAIAKAVRRG